MQNRIKEQIQRLGRTQKDVAEELGMTTVGLSQLANVDMPKVATLSKIAKVLNIPVWMLILSDDELSEIRGDVTPPLTNEFRCPACGASLRVVPTDDKE